MPDYSASFKTADVIALGKVLIDTADRFPTEFLTERHFFPLVHAYLHGRVPHLKPEASVDDGEVDFRIGGFNPSVIEIAVAPRALLDELHPALRFPGLGSATQLYASQNRTELLKLASVPQAQARKRYLLLLDFRSAHEEKRLRELYQAEWDKRARPNPVCVAYAAREVQFAFTLRRR